MNAPATSQPLRGVRVLEIGGRATAYCGKLLADLGADVLVVERPQGDELRRLPPLRDGDCGPEASLMVAYYHHNKRGITLDWTRAEAEVLLGQLAETADVLLASPKGVRHRLSGFRDDPPTISWAPSHVLTCYITPFGLTGPFSEWRATPFTSFAMSGFMHPVGPPEGPPLAMPGQPFYDEAGVWAAFLVQVALLSGPRSEGQLIDQSVHEVGLLYRLGTEQYQLAGRIKTRAANFGAPPSGTWRCRDGLVDIGVHSPQQWEIFLDLVDRPPMLCDDLYRDRQMRIQLFDLLQDLVGEAMSTRRADEFVEAAQKAGLPCALSLSCEEFLNQPQARARGFFVPSSRRGTGSVELPGGPFRSSPPMIAHRRSAPMLGEANVEVYVSELGHSPRELEGWQSDGLV